MALPELKKTMFEEVFSSKEETRKGNNLCPNLTIPDSLVQKLEKGISTEELSALKKDGYKILLYKTQLTIHGIFPELQLRVGGYKNVFTNKNLSLGVKWNVVDYEKKLRIYKALRHCGWSIDQNSTNWYAYRIKSLDTTNKEKMALQINEEKTFAKSINTSAFFGDVKCYWGYNIFEEALMFTTININAIYEKDLNKVFSNITGRSLEEVDVEIAEKDAIDKLEREKRWEELKKEASIRKAKEEEVLGQFKDKITKNLLEDGLVVMIPKVNSDLELIFEYRYFYKESPRSRKLRWNNFYSDFQLSEEAIKSKTTHYFNHKTYDRPFVEGIKVS